MYTPTLIGHTHPLTGYTSHLSAWSPLAVSGPVAVATHSGPQAPQGVAEPAPAMIGSPRSEHQLGTEGLPRHDLTRIAQKVT